MEYNSQRESIKLREYGRSIQKLVNYARTIEKKEDRQDVAEHILSLMGSINPHLKNVEDFKHLLWDHLYLIADFDLDVESPYPLPKKEIIFSKPTKFEYPVKNKKFRHYGKNILSMISEAIKIEDIEKRMEYAKMIANYMKKVQAGRNRKGEKVNDLIIINDLETLSNGVLKLKDETTLTKIKTTPRVYKKKNNNNRNRNNNNNRNRNNNNRNRNRK